MALLRWVVMAAIAMACVACDDNTASTGDGADAMTDGDAMMAPDDMAAVDASRPVVDMAVAPDAALPEPAFIELGLSPRAGLYTRADHPQVTVTVYDRIGRVIEGGEALLFFDVQPAGRATLDDMRVLTFVSEGQGAVRGCVDSTLCGRVSFFVDDAPPSLVLERPARGEIVSGEPVIAVAGRTDPGPGSPRVFVNDAEVEVAADGTFATTLRAEFGLNRIDVIADDGVRRPPVRVVREVVWAPAVLPPTDEGFVIEDAVVLRLDQRLLDAGLAAPAADEMGAQTVGDLAGAVELFLARLALIGLVPDRQIADDDALRLSIEDIRPGVPDVAIALVSDGMEVFLRLEDLAIVTGGEVSLEGERFDLRGEITVTAAAFAGITVEPGPGGEPVLRVGEIGVAIEALGGTMADSTAQALVDTLGSLVRTVLDGFAQELVAQLVRDEVPEFIELGLGDALAPLGHIPLDVEEPPVALDLGFLLAEPRITARDALTLSLRGEIRQRGAVVPPYPSPGVPVVGVDAEPIWPADAALGVAVRLVTVNALLDAVWRQGALRLDLTAFLPPEVAGLLSGGRVDARIAPLVVPGARGGPYAFELQVGELDLWLESPLNAMPDHYVLSLRAGMVLEVGEGGIRFDIADEPDLRAELVAAGGARPVLPAESLGPLLGRVAWVEVREAIGEGLDLAIEPIAVDLAQFAALAPTLRAVEVLPRFPAPPGVRNGWFTLGASVEITAR
ncbi:MAG: hypothetical protein H6705_14420 [Myxococcales bacterium]|nr:hypothetical protein [Myxococcales bacterium]